MRSKKKFSPSNATCIHIQTLLLRFTEFRAQHQSRTFEKLYAFEFDRGSGAGSGGGNMCGEFMD